jgi:hypothetical protein
VVLLLAAAGLGLLAPSASAATVTVMLTPTGPSQPQVTITRGDTVVFHNSDAISHTVKATSTNWKINAAVGPNGNTSWTFNATGNTPEKFSYDDNRGLLASDPGSVVVNPPPAAPPPPPASATAQPTVSPKPSASAKPSVAPTAAGPTPTASGALPPSQAPTPIAAPPLGWPPSPRPIVALPPAASPSTTPDAAVSYAGRPLVQGSSHHYGLPAALALVAITGVASLLLRLLLAEPAARRRRTRLEVVNEG